MTPPTSRIQASSASSRPKPQLSCHRCRAKKLKCDRGRPCNNCRKDPRRACEYPSNAAFGIKHVSTRNTRSSAQGDRASTLQQRLEDGLTNVHTTSRLRSQSNQTDSNPASTSDSIALQRDAGDLSERYVSSSHWEGVLKDIIVTGEDIRTVRTSLPKMSRSSSTLESVKGMPPRLLFPSQNDVAADELRYPIVSKAVAGVLLDLVTTSAHTQWLLVLIHQPTFREEFAMYWQNPMNVDLVWLAILYSILSIGGFVASRSMIFIEDAPNFEHISHVCLNRAAQCLRNSDYTKPVANTISAMLLYLACEHQLATDGHFRGSLVLGLAVRLALRMGYHREPSLYAHITVFQAEMQRRVWTFLRQLDQLIAQKCGLPRFIDDRKTDTRLPLNIPDTDMHPEMHDLPPPCSNDLPTTIAVLNFKSRILTIHGRIMDQIHNIQPMAYETILLIDQELSAEVKQKPAWLEVRASMLSGHTEPDEMNSQVDIDLMEQSARMMLHHKHLVLAHLDPQYAVSRRSCLDAAMRSLNLQRLLFEAYLMHGKDQATNWRFLSLVGHDFLFAAMLICLDMYHESKETNPVDSTSHYVSLTREERLVQMRSLRIAQCIWLEFGKHHSSGREAAAILGVLIKRFGGTIERENEDELQPLTTKNVLDSRNSISNILRLESTEILDLHIQEQPISSYNTPLIDWQGPGDLQYHTAWLSQLPNDDFAPIQDMLKASQIDLDWNVWHSGYYNTDSD